MAVVRVYFEATTQWQADIDLEDLEDSGELRVGPVVGDLAELLEINGSEIDGPAIMVTSVEQDERTPVPGLASADAAPTGVR
jgi:hypothetical protein